MCATRWQEERRQRRLSCLENTTTCRVSAGCRARARARWSEGGELRVGSCTHVASWRPRRCRLRRRRRCSRLAFTTMSPSRYESTSFVLPLLLLERAATSSSSPWSWSARSCVASQSAFPLLVLTVVVAAVSTTRAPAASLFGGDDATQKPTTTTYRGVDTKNRLCVDCVKVTSTTIKVDDVTIFKISRLARFLIFTIDSINCVNWSNHSTMIITIVCQMFRETRETAIIVKDKNNQIAEFR